MKIGDSQHQQVIVPLNHIDSSDKAKYCFQPHCSSVQKIKAGILLKLYIKYTINCACISLDGKPNCKMKKYLLIKQSFQMKLSILNFECLSGSPDVLTNLM